MKTLYFYYSILLFNVLLFCACSKNYVSKENRPPIAEFSISPGTGDTTVMFIFDASLSNDPDQGKDSLLYSWDFEGNYNWTEVSLSTITQYKYAIAGTFEVGLQVKDKHGWTDEKRKTLVVTNN